MTPATYRTSGNAKHYATPSYRHQSTLGGKLDRPATTWDLIKHGMVGGFGLAAVALVALGVIVAFSWPA